MSYETRFLRCSVGLIHELTLHNFSKRAKNTIVIRFYLVIFKNIICV